jgi:hypothetical protein
MALGRDIIWILTLKCDEAMRLESQLLEQPLSRVERMALRGHLFTCKACRRARKQFEFLRQAARRLADGVDAREILADLPATLSPEARERIKESLRTR